MSLQKNKIQLIATGNLIPALHYGSFAVNWWTFFSQKISGEEKLISIPIRPNMRVRIELNKREFIVRVVSTNNNIKPGYVCESDVTAKIYSTASEAINETYKKIFNTGTRYSGPSVMGFDNEYITKQLISDVEFHPFKISIDKLSILIVKLGTSDDNSDNFIGYQSSFTYKYHNKQCLFVQKKINNRNCQIEIFQNGERVANYNDASPNEVWKKVGILKNYSGKILFGLDHPITIDALENYTEQPICNVTEWGNIQIMTRAFEQNLKRKIAIAEINWYQFFIQWKKQQISIIEFTTHLRQIYPSNYQFSDRELSSWRGMMRNVGCTNITPFKKKESKLEFWTCALNCSSDRNTLLYLYTMNLLNVVPYNPQDTKTEIKNKKLEETIDQLQIAIDQFWKSFNKAIQINKRGLDGKQRILSIIAENFGHNEIQRELQVIFISNYL